MLNSLGKFFRFMARAIWFAVELLGFFAAFLGLVLRHRGRPSQAARSRWLQWCARRSLRVFTVQTTFTGVLPQSGLLVSNHLTYLDILVLVSLVPAVFIAKSDVKGWPVFGWCASLAGTLFVDRTRRSDVGRMNVAIEAALAEGNIVVLFPEGTSWNGSVVLPFKSSLLEPIVGTKYPLTVSGIQYVVADGTVAEDICYWGDMTFLPHLAKLLTKRRVEARVSLASIPQPAAHRKELALQLHAEVVRLVNDRD